MIQNVKYTVPWTYIMILREEKLLKRFIKMNCKKKTNQKEFRIEKVMKRKGDELYVKWKIYDNSFNSWINKKHNINE